MLCSPVVMRYYLLRGRLEKEKGMKKCANDAAKTEVWHIEHTCRRSTENEHKRVGEIADFAKLHLKLYFLVELYEQDYPFVDRILSSAVRYY